MGALDIPPHSRSASRLGVTALGLIAAFAITSGYLRQVMATAPAPTAADGGPMAAIAEATPAPEPMLQVAEAPARHVQAAEEAPVDVSEAVAPAAADAEAPAAAEAKEAEARGGDAATSAPDPAPATPSDPATPPNDAPGA